MVSSSSEGMSCHPRRAVSFHLRERFGLLVLGVVTPIHPPMGHFFLISPLLSLPLPFRRFSLFGLCPLCCTIDQSRMFPMIVSLFFLSLQRDTKTGSLLCLPNINLVSFSFYLPRHAIHTSTPGLMSEGRCQEREKEEQV